MAAAAKYLRWGLQFRAARGTQSSGTGMALIGRASAGLGARAMSYGLALEVGRAPLASRTVVGIRPGPGLPLAAEHVVALLSGHQLGDPSLLIGPEPRRRIGPRGEVEVLLRGPRDRGGGGGGSRGRSRDRGRCLRGGCRLGACRGVRLRDRDRPLIGRRGRPGGRGRRRRVRDRGLGRVIEGAGGDRGGRFGGWGQARVAGRCGDRFRRRCG